MINLFTYIKNFLFCFRHPCWRLKIFNGRKAGAETRKADYSTTWYEAIPTGWRKAFGKRLTKELERAFKEDRKEKAALTWDTALVWEDIKEKYGKLRLYASATNRISRVLEKYELMSVCYCYICGKPARYQTRDWIGFYCEDCFKEHCLNECINDEFRDSEYKRCRLTEADLTKFIRYDENGKRIEVDIKEEFGIDERAAWGLGR